ncbi:MAG: hypothetical protein NZ699_14975 [Roseiflexus sp.]|nr:hypothetical protein [Roseiflexus sp.]MCS7290433.1 hypothetical protein [Roseiflexus sp.]MDW8147660.1 hypothetical protein [Roseiflexaceae bacterium]MDW8231497.1 hypothetical protein [Roseiflexaceae bacterium]
MAKATLLFLATDDGLALLSNPAGQGRWVRSIHTLRGSTVHSVWVDGSNPLITLVIADGRVHRSTDGAQTWTELPIGDPLAPGAALYSAPRQPSFVGLLAGNILLISDDAGASWQRIALPGAYGAFAIDDAGRFYGALGAQVLASDNHGATWELYGTLLPDAPFALIAAPRAAETLCALVGGRVYVGERAGWRLIDGMPGEAIAFTILASATPTLIAALADGGTARGSLDGWEPAIAAFPWTGAATVLTSARYHIDTAFVASAAGEVAMSTDRGRSWTLVRRGLAAVRDLVAARLM